jgi:hypothetical protein
MVMKLRTLGWAAGIVAVLVGGCDAPEADFVADDGGAVTLRDDVDNGMALNSASLNGWTLNGFRTNGWTLNGWTLNGWTLNGWTLNGWTLNGSAIEGVYHDSGSPVLLSGTELIGSELVLAHEGEQFTLRFDDIYKDPADPDGDLYFYQVTAYDEATQTWTSLCHDMYGEPTEAIALRHHWDPVTGARIDDAAAVTFACRGGALAKCVEWGYEPWATAQSCSGSVCSQVSLAEHHQACTRMARADYCGTGTPYTLNGTPIDIYDRLTPAIQSRVTVGDKEWKIEAEWGPDGALCLGKELRYHMLAQVGINRPAPACMTGLQGLKECGKFHTTRPTARLANAFCSKWIGDPARCGYTGSVEN